MSRIKALINIILYFFFSLFSSLILLVVMSAKNGSISSEQLQDQMMKDLSFLGMVNCFVLILLLLINYKYIKEKIKYSIDNIGDTIKFALLGYVIIMAINIILAMIVLITGVKQVEPENQQGINTLVSNSGIVMTVLVVGIISPALEEIVFRMSLLGLFIKDKVSKNWLPYLGAALLFTFIHDTSIITNFSAANLVNFFSYFLPAIGLCVVYRLSNHNLVAVIILHAIYNTLPLLISGV